MGRSFLGIVLSCAVASALAGCGESGNAQDGGAQIRAVRVAKVTILDHAREVRVSGYTRAGRRATLAFLVSGTLVERPAELGQTVEAGEIVARLSSPELKPAVISAEARVRELETRLAQLDRDVTRAEELRGRGLISQEDVEKVLTDRDATRALKDLAAAALVEAQNRLDEATLKAPFAATVDETLYEPGEFVAAGQPVVRLSGVGDLEVELEIPESLIDRFAPGQEVDLTLSLLGNRKVRGNVFHVGDAGGGPGGLFPVEVRLEDAADLRPGLTVELILPVEAETGVAVPLGAVLDPGTGNPRVFRVIDGRVEPVFVEVGQLSGDRVGIRGPLSPGDEVVVTGLGSLTPGQRVEVLR